MRVGSFLLSTLPADTKFELHNQSAIKYEFLV